MAILKHLRAFIAIKGQRQKEYAFDDEENEYPDLMSKYIECKTGAPFTIQVEFISSTKFKSDAIQLDIYFDGHMVCRMVVEKTRLAKTGGYCEKINGVHRKVGDRWQYRPFLFNEISQTEEPSQNGPDEHNPQDLGSITIKAFHIKIKGPVVPTKVWNDQILTKSTTLSERKLKGMSVTHTANLGAEQVSSGTKHVDVEFVDGENPFATFRFKYVSKSALQAMLLIPRTPSPVPLEERPIESLSVEEMKQLLQQYRDQSTEPAIKTKLEYSIAQQQVKHEQDVKHEHLIKRERDEEVDEILASACVKKPRLVDVVDLEDE